MPEVRSQQTRKKFTLPVDVTNPGQFYACCGLLELATASDPEATGCFEGNGFTVYAAADPCKVARQVQLAIDMRRQNLERLRELRAINGIRSRDKENPELIELKSLEAVEREAGIWATVNSSHLKVDWWRHGPSGEVKTWAGKQVTFDAVKSMHEAATKLFDTDSPLDGAGSVDARPFYFDCRSGGDAIDQGVSFDKVKNVDVLAYPVVELLALIGLNRFRPGGNERRVKYYAIWTHPLPVTLAAPVATGLLPTIAVDRYRFRLLPRDASFRYKSFGRAEPVASTKP